MQRPRIASVAFGVFSPDMLEPRLVWIEGVHTENPDPVFQEFLSHVPGEIRVEVGVGRRPGELDVPAGSDQENFVSLPGLADFFLVFYQVNPFDPEPVSATDQGADIDHDRSANQPVQRDLVDLHPIFVEVVWRVDVCACVGTEVESVDPNSVSVGEFKSGFRRELRVSWVR